MDKQKYWFFGSKLNTALLLTLIILMIIALKWMHENKAIYTPIVSKNTTMLDSTLSKDDHSKIVGNSNDLVSFSILPGTEVHGIMSYRGSIKGGYFFEGNIIINVVNVHQDHILAQGHAQATTDWMTTDPVSFEGNIDFSGLPKGPAYFEIHNDNPSGLTENDKSVFIPIIIK